MTEHEEYPDWEELACNDPYCEICNYNPPLTPAEGTETFGRSGFMIHGDNAEGCIILAHRLRNWRENTPPAPMAVKIRRINWPMIAAILFTLTIWTLVIYAAILAVM